MAEIRDLGVVVVDEDKKETRLGWKPKDGMGMNTEWEVYLRFPDSWWEAQGVFVRTSQEARTWAEEKAQNGGLR